MEVKQPLPRPLIRTVVTDVKPPNLDSLQHWMTQIRRDIHMHPELSGQEHRTKEIIQQILHKLHIPFKTMAKTGVVAEIGSHRPGPFVALRADMDALPIQEETHLEFSSKNPGVMHACGHDGHTAILLGAAVILKEQAEQLVNPIRFIFQPAEETTQGAKCLIEEGVMENVKFIFGGHLDRQIPTGTIVVHNGCVNASADFFKITINGKEGHAAKPHLCTDTVVVGSAIVTALQTVVSRETDPAKPLVITVGSFQAGTASNIIAGSAVLRGTIRALDPEVRSKSLKSLQLISQSVASMHGATAQVELEMGPPPVINTIEAYQISQQAAIKVVGKQNVIPMTTANMGGEDFAFYLEKAQGCYVRYGAKKDGPNVSAHSNNWDFNEETLSIGAQYLANVAILASKYLIKNKL